MPKGLEVKHVARYLPYGLKVQYCGEIYTVDSLSVAGVMKLVKPKGFVTREEWVHVSDERMFPLLRLVNPSTVTVGITNDYQFRTFHDVHSLIEKNLAVDISGLPSNPCEKV